MTVEDAIASGANDLISKPISTENLEHKLENLKRLINYTNKLSTHEELEHRKGIIAKDSFNELFLSAIDRAHRYAEVSFVVFITLKTDDKTFEHLCNKIRFIRRQSDVIGRVGKNHFGILLQRPQYESEPYDATTRFTEVLSQYVNDIEGEIPEIEIDLNLVEIPIGKSHIRTKVTDQETTVIHLAGDF